MAKPLNISAVYQLDSDFTAAPTPAPVSLSSSGGKTTILVVVLVVVFVVIVIVIGGVLAFIFLRKRPDYYERSDELDLRPLSGTSMPQQSSSVVRSTMNTFDDFASSSRPHSSALAGPVIDQSARSLQQSEHGADRRNVTIATGSAMIAEKYLIRARDIERGDKLGEGVLFVRSW
jgi:hypothetical protein